ncbi:MAG: hypothetical protein H7322_12585 [Ramlibacter sp.]|nr:hypothetical protein [Ramlibacter sp.]
MPTVRRVYALEYVATLLGEDLEMLEAIVSNDDNLTYGSIVGVCTGPDESSTSLTDDGVDELSRMITCARRSPAEWDEFLESFVGDQEIINRVNAQKPR